MPLNQFHVCSMTSQGQNGFVYQLPCWKEMYEETNMENHTLCSFSENVQLPC